MALTTKQKVWLDRYLACWNASEAARDAGYKDPEQAGYENKKKQEIQEIIKARLEDMHMGADEVLARLTDQARATLDDFIDVSIPGEAAGNARSADEARSLIDGWRLNLLKAEQRGKLHLIKKIKTGANGVEIELHDAQAALTLLGKHHGLFVERTETTIDILGDAAATLERKLMAGAADGPAPEPAGEPDDR